MDIKGLAMQLAFRDFRSAEQSTKSRSMQMAENQEQSTPKFENKFVKLKAEKWEAGNKGAKRDFGIKGNKAYQRRYL